MGRIDCLFLHVGRESRDEYDILLMSVGILALADLLEKKGIKTRILNLYLRQASEPAFSLQEFINKHYPKVVCFSCHWHQQMRDTLKTIKDIKENFPDILTVMGGFTASYFAEEIMRYAPQVDFIIRGDAELPLVNLFKALKKGAQAEFPDIPNLCWRIKKALRMNPVSYVASPGILNSLDYSNTELLLDRELYLRGYWGLRKERYNSEKRNRIFYYLPGRGCPYNCSFCGGGRTAQILINNRRRVAIKSISSVARDMRNIEQRGISSLYICFDPYPDSNYYPYLFREVRRQGLNFKLFFECFGLPSKKFIDSFSASFRSGSALIISPESGSEGIRRKNKSLFYSNAALIQTLFYLEKKKIKSELYFSVGLPFEEEKDLITTLEFIKHIHKNFDSKIYAFPVYMEPASPWYISPSKYNIRISKKSFFDYLRNPLKLGYRTLFFKEEQITEYANLLEQIKHAGV